MTGAPPQSEPTRTAAPQPSGTLRGYLEGAALKSGLSQLPFAISQQATAATEQPVSAPGQGQCNVVLSAPGNNPNGDFFNLELQTLSLNACLGACSTTGRKPGHLLMQLPHAAAIQQQFMHLTHISASSGLADHWLHSSTTTLS